MTFAIITHVVHTEYGSQIFGYGPYVREMNLWNAKADKILIVAPISKKTPDQIDLPYDKPVTFISVPAFNVTSVKDFFLTLVNIPVILFRIFSVMRKADHIHLRCPGNMGLLGCFVQILFPQKKKTAKYAGNWDPESKQPFSYRLQRYLLSNNFLTRNMTVLVYGDFNDKSANIKPFFTATYKESDKEPVAIREFNQPIRFLFVGSLSKGKRPEYAIDIVRNLYRKGKNVKLDIYGDGLLRDDLKAYIQQNNASDYIELHGNQQEQVVRKAYQSHHFLVLPSKSEGWPKVVAEAMFWGCVPISTKVSCVPYMIGNGARGNLLEMNLLADVTQIENLLGDETKYSNMAKQGISWSRQFTLDLFDSQIAQLMQE
ncbi:glycosyltransferase family 4 protein [Flavobacterium silvaticum]|uniref:Glycosyltransferase n=1 Tax=Flavobacterium silvaticum TaxID=1852020 RepID=A0A972JGW5_9FLAO|nr:glycosyltransferase [Flavobacterium silvaticum]NMH29474.1 glycosyltransferase [Flavobacterium silvaticum]